MKKENKLEKECEHQTLIHLGFQEGVGSIPGAILGNCYDCHSTRKITADYVSKSGGVYLLKKSDGKEVKE